MRLAMRLPAKGKTGDASGADPRERESAEIIDLASRTAYPVVAQQQGKSDTLGLVAGIAIVAGLGAVAFWGMNSARLDRPRHRGLSRPPFPPRWRFRAQPRRPPQQSAQADRDR